MFKTIKKWLTADYGDEETESPTTEEVRVEDIIPEHPHPDKPKLTPKEIATAQGIPYVDVIKVNIDPDNINDGEFELDWNDKFIISLIRHGYRIDQNDTDAAIVDRWFTQVCRNVVMEVYEQDQADPDNRNSRHFDARNIHRKDIGGGYSEIS